MNELESVIPRSAARLWSSVGFTERRGICLLFFVKADTWLRLPAADRLGMSTKGICQLMAKTVFWDKG